MEHCCAYRSRITRCQAKYITWSSAAIKVELRDAHFSFAPVVDFSETAWCCKVLRRCICSLAGKTTAALILSATALKSVDSPRQETTMVMYVHSCCPARSMHPSYLDRRGRLKRAGGMTDRRLRRRGGRSGGGRGPPLCHVLPALARGRRRATVTYSLYLLLTALEPYTPGQSSLDGTHTSAQLCRRAVVSLEKILIRI